MGTITSEEVFDSKWRVPPGTGAIFNTGKVACRLSLLSCKKEQSVTRQKDGPEKKGIRWIFCQWGFVGWVVTEKPRLSALITQEPVFTEPTHCKCSSNVPGLSPPFDSCQMSGLGLWFALLKWARTLLAPCHLNRVRYALYIRCILKFICLMHWMSIMPAKRNKMVMLFGGKGSEMIALSVFCWGIIYVL